MKKIIQGILLSVLFMNVQLSGALVPAGDDGVRVSGESANSGVGVRALDGKLLGNIDLRDGGLGTLLRFTERQEKEFTSLFTGKVLCDELLQICMRRNAGVSKHLTDLKEEELGSYFCWLLRREEKTVPSWKEWKNRDGDGFLHLVVVCCDTELLCFLINAGALTSVQNETGLSPLHIACQDGNEELVDALIKANADVKLKTEGGLTPLFSALICYQEENALAIVKSLVGAGAEILELDAAGKKRFKRDGFGRSLIDLAQSLKKPSIKSYFQSVFKEPSDFEDSSES